MSYEIGMFKIDPLTEHPVPKPIVAHQLAEHTWRIEVDTDPSVVLVVTDDPALPLDAGTVRLPTAEVEVAVAVITGIINSVGLSNNADVFDIQKALGRRRHGRAAEASGGSADSVREALERTGLARLPDIAFLVVVSLPDRAGLPEFFEALRACPGVWRLVGTTVVVSPTLHEFHPSRDKMPADHIWNDLVYAYTIVPDRPARTRVLVVGRQGDRHGCV